MIYTERNMNLFDVSGDYYLAHCISADFALGAGIAKEFAALGVKDYLKAKYHPKAFTGTGYALYTPLRGYMGVFNLVTKARYWQKPTYDTLTQALQDMKLSLCFAVGECKVAMPRIGCGLDGLEWKRVSRIVQDVFCDTNTEILVCNLEGERS